MRLDQCFDTKQDQDVSQFNAPGKFVCTELAGKCFDSKHTVAGFNLECMPRVAVDARASDRFELVSKVAVGPKNKSEKGTEKQKRAKIEGCTGPTELDARMSACDFSKFP